MKLQLLFVFYCVIISNQADESVETDVMVTSVTVGPGDPAYLNCTIEDTNNNEVFWVRKRDFHILTVGLLTYIQDDRFKSYHDNGTDVWTLIVKYVDLQDSGIYVCQVTNQSKERHLFNLTVVEPKSKIVGGSDLYFRRGATINVTCVMNMFSRQVIWKFNNDIIPCDNPRGGLRMVTVPTPGHTVSTLLIPRSEPTDSGLYQCSADDVQPASVNVHVVTDGTPEVTESPIDLTTNSIVLD